MRRAGLLALTMLLCFVLCSCGGTKARVDEAADIRAKMLSAGGYSFTADLSCDYGDRIWDCRLSFEGGPDEAVITVIEPEIISGLQIAVTEGLAELRFDGAALDTGDVFGDGGSAAEALPFIMRSLREAYVSESYGEKIGETDCTVIVMDGGGETAVAVWLDKDYTPVKAELRENGKTVVFCTFEAFIYR